MHRLSAIEISTKNPEDQVNKAFLSMRKDIDEVQKATDNNAKEIQEIKQQLDRAPGNKTQSKHEIKEMHDRLRAECYQRRVNLLFEGIEEGGRRKNDTTLKQMMTNIFSKEMGLHNIEIDVIRVTLQKCPPPPKEM